VDQIGSDFCGHPDYCQWTSPQCTTPTDERKVVAYLPFAYQPYPWNHGTDYYGHGTHCAGSVAGSSSEETTGGGDINDFQVRGCVPEGSSDRFPTAPSAQGWLQVDCVQCFRWTAYNASGGLRTVLQVDCVQCFRWTAYSASFGANRTIRFWHRGATENALERGTTPKPSRRTCSPGYGLRSC
jgi:hypothetical protein